MLIDGIYIMKSALVNRGRLEYINLNKRFLEEVEKGTRWEDLQVLIDEMKSLAIYLQQIPTSTEIIQPSDKAKPEAAADLEEPLV